MAYPPQLPGVFLWFSQLGSADLVEITREIAGLSPRAPLLLKRDGRSVTQNSYIRLDYKKD